MRLLAVIAVSILSFFATASERPIVYSTFLAKTEPAFGAVTVFDPEPHVRTAGFFYEWPPRHLAVTTDVHGCSYIAGYATPANRTVTNLWDALVAGEQYLFVAKLDSAGKLLAMTSLRGDGIVFPEAISLDAEENIYVAGFSKSTDLPVTPDALQQDYSGGTALGTGDAFLAKFSNDLSRLLYCSYLGGSGDEMVSSFAIDPQGNILLSGTTDSRSFPPGASISGTRGGQDVFLIKLDPAGNEYLWSKIIAGAGDEWQVKFALAKDSTIYFSGSTRSTNLPASANASRTVHESPGEWNGLVGILEGDGSTLRYLSYLGGATQTTIHDLALASNGSILITGETTPSKDVTKHVFRPAMGGGFSDAYIARLNPPELKIEWFSYLGGGNQEVGLGLGVDAQDRIYVTGQSFSPDFPLKDSLALDYGIGGGKGDGFLARISPDGKTLQYSTLFGGEEADAGSKIAIGPDNLPMIIGFTESFYFPLRPEKTPKATATLHVNAASIFIPSMEIFALKIEPGPVRPALEIARSGSSIIVNWPADAEGFLLESTSALSTESWKEVATTPLILGSRKTVVVRSTSEAQFFRLKRQ